MIQLQVVDMHTNYGRVPILSGANFSVFAHESVGIFGHNGMGKTTLLKTIMGLLKAASGKVMFEGIDITNLPTFMRSRQKIAYVPQGRQIFSTLTVLENLKMAAFSHHKDADAVVESILTDFPRLTRLTGRVGGTLSGGEQQLLAIARALCTDPRLLLLDEPTEGIQPSIRDELVDVLKALKAKNKMTTLLVEQNVDFITATCDRILTVEKGRIGDEYDPTQFSEL